MKAKGQLVMLRPVLRLKVLSIKTRAKMLETFVEPILPYGWSIIVYHKVDDKKSKAVHSTAWRTMLGPYNRGQTSVKVLAEKVPLRNLIAQKQRYNRIE